MKVISSSEGFIIVSRSSPCIALLFDTWVYKIISIVVNLLSLF
jgi:hypothetical protein